MNTYMLNQLRTLETFIEEIGQEQSVQMAQQALGVLRNEIESVADLRDALTVVEQDIIPINLDTSTLLQYVTRIPMKSRGALIQSFQGRLLQLFARSPKHDNIDEMILFGSSVDEPLGIMLGPGTITVNKEESNLCIYHLTTMLESLSPTAYARWIVNSRLSPLIVSIRDYEGRRFFAGEPGSMFSMFGFPIVLVDSQMCDRHGFEIALADLRYYVWGEYVTGDGLLVDGTPGIDQPIYKDNGECSSPFVVLGKER